MINSTKLKQYEFLLSNGIPALISEGSITIMGRNEVGIQSSWGKVYIFTYELKQALKLLKEYLIVLSMKCWKLKAISVRV